HELAGAVDTLKHGDSQRSALRLRRAHAVTTKTSSNGPAGPEPPRSVRQHPSPPELAFGMTVCTIASMLAPSRRCQWIAQGIPRHGSAIPGAASSTVPKL